MEHLQQRPSNTGILIVDYGSQYTLLIVRRLREIGVYAELIDSQKNTIPAGFHCTGVILSGGPDSVGDEGSRQIPAWVLPAGLPVLGICYGMQLLAYSHGLKVQSAKQREYGRAKLLWDLAQPRLSKFARQVLLGMPAQESVWMSHGDDVLWQDDPQGNDKSNSGFTVIARTDAGVIGAIAHNEKPLIGVQFHPEVVHTEQGARFLENFAVGICQTPREWQAHNIAEQLSEIVRQQVGKQKVLVAVSGGVDSSVAAILLNKALGPEQVTPVFIDTGLLRKNEAAWVKEQLMAAGLKNLVCIDASQRFYKLLKGVTDPEEKRKKIGHQFIAEFEDFAHGKDFDFLGQGTLYPDVIESAGHGHGAKVIKSHHNVGGLPEHLKMKLVEPFRYLFKDEVRAIGVDLGLSQTLIGRHPFPGPGLAVRIIGDITPENVRILQDADHVFIESLRENGLYEKAWQAFVVFLPIKTVGVMGDNRTYQHVVALRAVTGSDAMTADVADLPLDFLVKTADKIIRKVDGVNRVVYDVTSKPPGTIEWE